MAKVRRTLHNGNQVYQHSDLTKVKQEQVREKASVILKDADKGIQTAILSTDGKTVTSIIGLNGTRYLPDPSPDPLEEVLRALVAKAAGEKK